MSQIVDDQPIGEIGWAPDASQPKPARRGSGTASLTQALKPPAPRL